MAEMPAAAAAVHLGARNQEREITPCADRIRERLVAARPAVATVVLGVRREQRQRTAGAGEDALALLEIERARMRLLGVMLAQDTELRARQDLAPFVIAALDLERAHRLARIVDPPERRGRRERG